MAPNPGSTPDTELNPVCGVSAGPSAGVEHVSYRGRDYWFCSAHCRERFARDPATGAEGRALEDGCSRCF